MHSGRRSRITPTTDFIVHSEQPFPSGAELVVIAKLVLDGLEGALPFFGAPGIAHRRARIMCVRYSQRHSHRRGGDPVSGVQTTRPRRIQK
jgi:hypothetical protein